MVSRKLRIAVVLDTNVLIRALKTRSHASPNQQILRLWLIAKRLQLVVSEPLVEEYLEIFGEVLGLETALIEEWEQRFRDDSRSTLVNLGRRYNFSRDPDDNVLLATAAAGSAEFLVTNDRDLLNIEPELTNRLPFEIVTPATFLRQFAT